MFSTRRGRRRTQQRPALKVDGPSANGTVLGLKDESPLKGVLPGHPGVTARPSHERAHDVVPGCHEFTLQFAINLIAALVSPDTSALHADKTIGEADGLRLEPNS
jgi:hypothetical protein